MPARRRLGRPASAAGRILLALIALGVALRLVAIISWWPVTPTLDDGYQRFAASNPFLDQQHPVGYDLLVAALGVPTRQVAFTVLLQHLIGIAAAVLLAATTRRVTGSAWAGLLPAAIVLLDPDQIFLEHAIMSESWVVFVIAAGLYATVRSCEEPMPWWRWPLLAGAALGLAVMIRTAALPLIALAAVAVVIWSPRGRRRRQARSAAMLAGTAIILLLAFAAAGAIFGQRFGIAPSPGWYLYGRVAQFADCRQFTPPPGTAALCQTVPPSRRPSAYDYMFVSQSPAVALFGGFGRQDRLIGRWARRGLEAQPGDFLSTAWAYLRSYWVPGWLPHRLRASSNGLDPQLDFTYPNPFYVAAIKRDLETFYDPLTVHPWHGGLQFLHDWQRVIRFGATLLFITSVLTLIGLAIGSRRSRAAVFLFGIGGISLILAPALTGTYSGRYTVPMAGPMMAAAAISLVQISRPSRRPGQR